MLARIKRLLARLLPGPKSPLKDITDSDFDRIHDPVAWPRLPRITRPRVPPAKVTRLPAAFTTVDLDDIPDRRHWQ